MALNVFCDKGHQYISPDIDMSTYEPGEPRCPECRVIWWAEREANKDPTAVHSGDKPRRIASASISRELLQHWMTEGAVFGESVRCTKGLPPDAHDPYGIPGDGVITLYFEHESFPMISPGEKIPRLEVQFEERRESE